MSPGARVAIGSGLLAVLVLLFLAVDEPMEREVRRVWRCIRGGKR